MNLDWFLYTAKIIFWLFHKEKDISVQWIWFPCFKKKDLVKLKHWRDTYFLEFSWYLWVIWFFSGTASSTKWIGRWPENSKLGLIWPTLLGQNLKSSDESEMKACFPKRWTTLKAPPTFTTKVCIKYWKQGYYYSFPSTINWPILTQIHFNNRVNLFLPFMLHNHLFSVGATMWRHSNFVLFCPWKKHPQKQGTLANLQKFSILPKNLTRSTHTV